MYAIDFEYDGMRLSDYDFLICSFDGKSGVEIENPGSQLSFNTIAVNDGKKYHLTNSNYGECFNTSFQICKNPEICDDIKISEREYRQMIKWLNRRKFHQIRFLNDDSIYTPFYFNASFNISKICINSVCYGLELNMITDSPFAYGQKQIFNFFDTNPEKTYYIRSESDEIGDAPVNVKIVLKEAGDLTISNITTDTDTIINNCISGETITIDGINQIIDTNNINHKIANDFNYNFLEIRNTLNDGRNKINFSLNCDVYIDFIPIIKNIP